MKEQSILQQLWDWLLEPEHLILGGSSFIGSMLSARHDTSTLRLQRLLNFLGGFTSACLGGLVLLEMGWAPWASSGMAYLVGHIGNRIVNALIVAAKLAETDPFKFADRVINLVWSWKLPTKRDNGN